MEGTKKMNAASTQHEWTKYTKFYTENNKGRLTRLGVFEKQGETVNDYWLESGLPFNGLDIDTHKDLPSVQISVGVLCHEVDQVVDIAFHLSASGDDDGVDIKSTNGTSTVLRFERHTE